ncbi:hypothetical protein BC938DRAFT_482808 [Jimgerdemannia flammicorona]|uniref:beta-mannosidase n=1 Tax=Jimgerdemannia flammicorona TaxID=994334 RepID=A0A433QDA1_9FUNG|nr:hypothetical protein BC938DRAFT_482808 [Jimgerdemannia flammicorona]
MQIRDASALVAAKRQPVFNQKCLDGTWQLRNSTGEHLLDAQVPGEVHTALLAAGIIEDPYFGDRWIEYKWIFRDSWTYSREFEVDDKLFGSDKILLVCHGLDTVADVSVNGTLVGRANNQFRRWVYDIKAAVRHGTNTIAVSFRNASDYGTELAAKYPYPVPEAMNIETQQGEPCAFSWDWGKQCRYQFLVRSNRPTNEYIYMRVPKFPSLLGPAFVPQGIWKCVELVGFTASAWVKDVVPIITRESQEWVVKVRVFAQADGDVKGSVAASVAGFKAEIRMDLVEGENVGQVEIRVPYEKVERWWPTGYGTPHLYDLKVAYQQHLSDENVKWVIHKTTKRIGFRTAHLVQEPYPDQAEPGESFYFEVNEMPIFAKGSNVIPADAFESRVNIDAWKRRHLPIQRFLCHLRRARVIGLAGVYVRVRPAPDQHGVPRQRTRGGVRQHPPPRAPPVYRAVVGQQRERGVYREGMVSGDPVESIHVHGRLSYPIPPSDPPDSTGGRPITVPHLKLPIKRRRLQGQPVARAFGDVHYYNYKDLGTDVSKFLRPRFASEYGFQSVPTLSTLQTIDNAKDQDWSGEWLRRRNHAPDGMNTIAAMVQKYFSLPGKSDAIARLDHFSYLSQIVQALIYQAQTEHYRRLRGDPEAMQRHLAGAGNWKILHSFAKKFFAPILVSSVEDPRDGSYEVHVVNDTQDELDVEVDVAVYSYTTSALVRRATFRPKIIPPLSSSRVYRAETLLELFDNPAAPYTDRLILLAARNTREPWGANVIASNVHYPAYFAQDVRLRNPGVRVTNVWDVPAGQQQQEKVVVTGRQKTFRIAVVADDAIALFVFLETANDLPVVFGDNGFVLLKGETREVEVVVSESHVATRSAALACNGAGVRVVGFEKVDVEAVRARIRIRSVYDAIF